MRTALRLQRGLGGKVPCDIESTTEIGLQALTPAIHRMLKSMTTEIVSWLCINIYMFLEILWEFGQIMYKYIKGNPKICVHLKCTLLGLMQVNVSVGIIK